MVLCESRLIQASDLGLEKGEAPVTGKLRDRGRPAPLRFRGGRLSRCKKSAIEGLVGKGGRP